MGIAIDNKNNIIIANSNNHTIDMLKPNGELIVLAGSGIRGDLDTTLIGSSFNFPTTIAIDNNNNIFVTDENNLKIKIIDLINNVKTFLNLNQICQHNYTDNYKNLLNITIINKTIYLSNSIENKIYKITKDKQIIIFLMNVKLI